uniref:Uncharacterized protein n=1 Tax=uncultured marine bacterium Ant4D3 TaxID=360423 RepID=Q2PYK9_9BACT|nr:hypothetical protein [uncultured marine bacterium Ant4D3]
MVKPKAGGFNHLVISLGEFLRAILIDTMVPLFVA